MSNTGERAQAPPGENPARMPDQAEGERGDAPRHPAPEEASHTPDQAEGDPATVDAAIREHAQKEHR